MDKMLSVVLPAYNEEQMIKKTAHRDICKHRSLPQSGKNCRRHRAAAGK